jgi:hypothetical protein
VSLAVVRATIPPKTGGVVKVSQPSGSIVFTSGGVVVLTKTVTGGQITPADNAERAILLAAVPGATL